MGRPKIRTVTVDPGVLAEMREVVGVSRKAYALLRLRGVVAYGTFRTVWKGGEVNPGVKRCVETGWDALVDRIAERAWERRKAGTGTLRSYK